MNSTKICNKCDISKELTQYDKQKSSKSGRKTICKECLKIYTKKYNLDKKKQIKEYQINYRKKNPKYYINYYTIHKEEIKRKHKDQQYGKKYYIKNRLKLIKYQKDFRDKQKLEKKEIIEEI